LNAAHDQPESDEFRRAESTLRARKSLHAALQDIVEERVSEDDAGTVLRFACGIVSGRARTWSRPGGHDSPASFPY